MPQPVSEATVFIVDDDQDVRNGLTALIQSVGLSCEAYGSTRELLAQNLSRGPSCLILDVRLPGPSGLDFQAELAKVNIHLPIIFISGHGDIPMTVRAMRGGAVGFFTKPLQEQDLLDAINTALQRDRERWSRDAANQVLRARYETLTPREKEIMAMVTAGLLNKQTAAAVGLSEVTVKVHRHNLMKKLGAKSLPELVRFADALGIEFKV